MRFDLLRRVWLLPPNNPATLAETSTAAHTPAILHTNGNFVSGSFDTTLRVWGRTQPTSENSSRKKATLEELRTLPPMGIFPGGIEFQEGEQRFQKAQNIRKTKRSRKQLRKRRKTRKRN